MHESVAGSPRQDAPKGPTASTPTKRHPWHSDRVLLATIPAVLALDQLTKAIVRATLYRGESWPADGFFRFTHGTNSGSAFGFFPNQTTLLIVASMIAIGFLIYFYRTYSPPSTLLRLAIGLQLGGAVGNLTDRLRLGAVVDFMDVGPWPIFNVADSSIVVGMALLAIILSSGKTRPEPSGVRMDDATGSDEAIR